MEQTMTIEQAIAEMQDFAKGTPMFVGSPKAAKIAEWLQELEAFKDETPITPMILKEIGFEEKILINRFPYFTYKELTVSQDELSTNKWIIEINTPEFDLNIVKIQTLGQLRMFLTLCGLEDFVKQLKA